MKCSKCNKEVSTRLIMGICNKCYLRGKVNAKKIVYDLPKKGEVAYAPDGTVICHICGRSYTKLMAHVVQIHGLTKEDYKEEFGLNKGQGLISGEHRDKLKKLVYDNYDKCIRDNLIDGGSSTRFKDGNVGRTRDKLTLQEYNRIVAFNKASGYKNLRHNKNRGNSGD